PDRSFADRRPSQRLVPLGRKGPASGAMMPGEVAPVSDTQIRDDARRALDEHAWQDAYDALVSLRDRGELRGEDWQRLGEAAWWSAHPSESLEAFEGAYAAYSSEGKPQLAALVAIRLTMEHADRMESALSNGCLERATRLRADQPDQPDLVERGYLELALVRSSVERGDVQEAMEHVTRAQEVGARCGDADLVAFGLVWRGAAMVFAGDAAEGLGLLDEGTLA